MISATNIPTGPLALLVSLALLGAGVLITCGVGVIALILIGRRDRRNAGNAPAPATSQKR